MSVEGFFKLMNSSKSMRMVLPLKFMDWLGGSDFRTLGGVTSFGPPTGETGFAQNQSEKQAVKSNKVSKNNL